MKIKFVLVIVIFISSCSFALAQKYTISGYVKEQGSGELLPGVTIYLPDQKMGTVTNSYGFYSLTLPGNVAYDLRYSFIGYEPYERSIALNENQSLNIEMKPATLSLDEVVVTAASQDQISEKSQMSVVTLSAKKIQDFPAFLGEKDVMKTLQLMPGIQSGSEGNSGLYVRGGGPDQNLIILDEAVVYNANHLFGFFSVFNGDALKSVELYKGGFPPRFGGRLSSVVKMDMKDGNKEELHGKFGVGILSSSFTLEGPIKKNKGKTSFLISGRRTYIDVLAAPFVKIATKGRTSGGYYFYDLNAKINHEFSDKDKLYLSGYFGQDKFYGKDDFDGTKSDAGLGWGNATATLRWNHQFSDKLFANSSIIFSRYNFNVRADSESDNSNSKIRYNSGITDYSAKFDLDFFPNPNHSLRFGFLTTHHAFTPRALVIQKTNTEPRDETNTFNSTETAVYAEDDMRLFNRLNILYGLRLSHFNYKSAQYFKPEPRLSMAYMLSDKLSLKASYASMNQYIHLLSNSGIGLPTDLWVSSTDRVKPQSSQQVAVGVARDFNSKHGLSLTLEGYYKKSDDVIAYKEGASFLVLDDPEAVDAKNVIWEDNITTGQSWAYGAEVFLEKKIGKFTGWLGYTLSWTELQFDSLNLGKKFFAKYDRRHDVSLVGIFKPSSKITVSGTWVYGTGNKYTVPTGTFRSLDDRGSIFGHIDLNDIETVNNFTAQPYHRLDLGIQFHKKRKRTVRTWDLSIYNVYSRKNPFYYFIDKKDSPAEEKTTLKKGSLFPIIPSISYRVEF